MTEREAKSRAIKRGVRTSLGALSLIPACCHTHLLLHTEIRPQPQHFRTQIDSVPTHTSDSIRTGIGDHLTDIANLTTYHSRQVDLEAWKRRVDFLADQPGITDIRVDIAASNVTVDLRGHLLWNKANIRVYGLAFDYAERKHLNIILIAMPPLRDADMSNPQYRSMIFAYYDLVGSFAKQHHIFDVNINELGAHNAATGRPVIRFTKEYLDGVVSLVVIASHAIERHVPHARIIVSESAAMTEEATKRLLAVFSALKQAGVPFARGLNIYAGGPVEIGEIGSLVDDVGKDGEVWVTEFGWASVGVQEETMQAQRIGEIFEAAIRAGVRRVIGYEEMDEPRLHNLGNIQAAEKDYGIVWREDGSIKPAAGVFLSLARKNY
jgi:hypothetical protein